MEKNWLKFQKRMINEKRRPRIKDQRSNSIIIELFFHIETKPEKYHTSDEESQPTQTKRTKHNKRTADKMCEWAEC